ncbi:AraC family transcriptional regulator [Actinokineospora pegani]|uniref:AraC family transcriptional regulator n=1 Tax=Actinokineospora pegani TaxID=2654637 RepID=UPI0012EA99B0|nr:AraC family transcriptional regulator [Actinokineospora pegani]
MRAFAQAAVRHWDYPRGVGGVRVMLDFAADRGVPVTPVDPGLLTRPGAEVPAAVELGVVRELAAALPDGGVDLGRRYHVTTFGMLGYAVLSSRTLAAAVDVTLRYLDLSYIFCLPRVTADGDRGRLELDDSALPVDVAGFLVDRDLTAILQVVGELLPGGVGLSGVRLRRPAPAGPVHEDVLGLTPEYDAAVNAVTFPLAELDRPLPQADPVTVADCEARCRDLVQARRARTGVTGAVRAELAAVGGITLSAAEVAARLLLGERTLRRRLAEAGTTFRELREEVRHALAEGLLTDGALPIADVATRVGYTESASFIRAFTRWTGQTPAAFRRAVAHRPLRS